METKFVNNYLKFSIGLFLLLCLAFFGALFLHIVLDYELAGTLIDYISIAGKSLLLLIPLPILILNLKNKLITLPTFLFVMSVLLVLAWRFFFV